MRFLKWLLHNPHETEEEDPFLRAIARIESLISKLLSILMIGLITVAVVDLARFLVADLLMEPTGFFSTTLIEIFGLFLNILIALEILENITAYLQKQVVQVELVIVTSLIAVARKIIIFDFEKLGGLELIGLGAATLALSVSYWLVRRSQASIQVRGRLSSDRILVRWGWSFPARIVRARSKLASLVKLAVLMVVLWVGLSALPVLARPHSSRDLLLAQHLGKPVKTYNNPPPMVIDPAKSYTATMETTAGTMVLELFPQEAPLAVNNFVFLANDHFYDGVIFHRVIRGFMIQGGDPTGTGRGGPGYRFPDEPVQRPYSRGTLAMANAGPNTNGSQFFIMHADYPLPPNYTIFGQLIEGEDVLDKIATAPTGPQDRPPETGGDQVGSHLGIQLGWATPVEQFGLN
jgi:cyclophilin family peptidyl-prolyl cis-trans isomerase/uncharacterized membrane protein (DUF373 family)